MEENSKSLAIQNPQSIITLDEAHAAIVVRNMETLTNSFKQWLKEDVDYTRTLFGKTDKPSLLDPGAQKIRSFFHAYPETHILKQIEDTTPGNERIKYIVRADITHVSGIRIGSGIGSCTTDESKYKYRWLTEQKLKDQGYTAESIKELPSREMTAQRGGRFMLYRIKNPEILDLDNTILKMASKRAEVDATLSLPGVSGVFTQDMDQYPDTPEPEIKENKIDTDIEQVKAILLANAIPIDNLSVFKYLQKIRISPSKEFPQENFEEYNKAITKLMKASWNAKNKCWEVDY